MEQSLIVSIEGLEVRIRGRWQETERGSFHFNIESGEPFRVGGCPVHIEAIEVREELGMLRAVDNLDEDLVSRLCDYVSGPPVLTRVNDRVCLLLCVPYGR